MQLERLTPEQRFKLTMRIVEKYPRVDEMTWDHIYRVRAIKKRILDVFYEGMKNGKLGNLEQA